MAASAARRRERIRPALAATTFALFLVAGCQTASLEEVAPLSARTAPLAADPSAPGYAASTDPSPPGSGYPNLNVPMPSAAPVLTDDETRRGKAQLEAARQATAAAPGQPSASASPEEMRRRARERLEETLRRIEAE